jgi:hypothetical protein
LWEDRIDNGFVRSSNAEEGVGNIMKKVEEQEDIRLGMGCYFENREKGVSAENRRSCRQAAWLDKR